MSIFWTICVIVAVIRILLSGDPIGQFISVIFGAIVVGFFWNLIFVNSFPNEEFNALSMGGCLIWSFRIKGLAVALRLIFG